MSDYVVNRITDEILKRNKKINELDILLMGLTFKENCPDTRNSKAIDIFKKFSKLGANIKAHDPWVDKKDANLKDINLINNFKKEKFDVLILTVPHEDYLNMKELNYQQILKNNSFIFDVKSCLEFSEEVITL